MENENQVFVVQRRRGKHSGAVISTLIILLLGVLKDTSGRQSGHVSQPQTKSQLLSQKMVIHQEGYFMGCDGLRNCRRGYLCILFDLNAFILFFFLTSYKTTVHLPETQDLVTCFQETGMTV